MSLTKHAPAMGKVAGGNHLVSASDEPEPSEAEKIAADLHYLQSQAQRDAARQARAVEWQLIDFRARGLL